MNVSSRCWYALVINVHLNPRSASDFVSSNEAEQILKTNQTTSNTGKCGTLVQTDRRVSMLQIQPHLSIGFAAAHTLVHDHFSLTKRSARWVPHSLTEEQKQAEVD